MYTAIDGIRLSVDQMNTMENIEAVLQDYSDVDVLLREHFLLTHVNKGTHWKTVENPLYAGSYVVVNKSIDGRYTLNTISTAQVPDAYGDLFTIDAMDYEIKRNDETGFRPMYNMFHDLNLYVGVVEKMGRFGIFSVEQGHSFEDSLSLSVCDELLEKNDGRWRVSRGFFPLHVEGDCPSCNVRLAFSYNHFLYGFKCPSCSIQKDAVEGVVSKMTFYKTLTYELTITDVPAVKATAISVLQRH